MGYRGPVPKPTALRIAEGKPGHRPLNDQEPLFREGTPKMPGRVKANDFALATWKQLAPILRRGRVLTEADSLGLTNICMDAALLEEAWAKVKASGLLVQQEGSKMIRLNPLLNLIQQTQYRLTQGLREYGLTAAARSRIQISESVIAEYHQDSLEAILRRPKQLITLEAIEGKVGRPQPAIGEGQNRVDATTEERKGPEEPARPEHQSDQPAME